MIGNSEKCYYCKDGYSFTWNTTDSLQECTSNDGKLNFCWKFSNEKGSGCDSCYLGYIMLNEQTCVAYSNWGFALGVITIIFCLIMWY